MRILFLHPNFPAQFRHLAVALAKDSSNQVVLALQEKKVVCRESTKHFIKLLAPLIPKLIIMSNL